MEFLYASDILKRFNMDKAKPILTPIEEKLKLTKDGTGDFVDATYFRKLIGSLRYLTSTRPDITYGVELISRFMEFPRQSHLQAARRILRYIQGTHSDDIFYSKTNDSNLVGFTVSDWAGDMMQKKVLLAVHFIWDLVYFHGLQRNNKLLLYQLLKQSIWPQQVVLHKHYD